MVASEVRTQIRRLLRRPGFSVSRISNRRNAPIARGHRHRTLHDPHNSNWSYGHQSSRGLEVARFVTLTIATLPFTGWIAFYSWSYIDRIGICEDTLAEEDSGIAHIRSKAKNDKPTIGIDRQLLEVQTLLSSAPRQIIVIAGANESGKSRFVSECVRSLPVERGLTYINLSNMSDSLSTLAHAFVKAFNLRWLEMRHSLVDVLPFAGSEILVMKERFSSRDLTASMYVIDEALKKSGEKKKDTELPVIIVDGLGEDSGSGWIRSPEGRRTMERLIKWCIYVTKERNLAHVIITGSEELVYSLHHLRASRGHVRVIGLGSKSKEEAAQIVLQELPYASQEEIDMITDNFGGIIHDVEFVSRKIQTRLRHANGETVENSREKIFSTIFEERFQEYIEHVTATFAKGRDPSSCSIHERGQSGDVDDDMDPFLDPLKAAYSEAQASQDDSKTEEENELSPGTASWSQLQLWNTLERLTASEKGSLPFADLRDEVFDGDVTPILDLMNEDVLGFEVGSSSESGWSWEVKPATFGLGRVFQYIIDSSSLRERFREMQQLEEGQNKIEEIEFERKQLQRDRRRLDMRKASLLKTVQLGKELMVRKDKAVNRSFEDVFFSMAREDIANEQRSKKLRQELEHVKQAMQDYEETKNDRLADSEEGASSIERGIRVALLKAYNKEGRKYYSGKFQEIFQHFSDDKDAIIASDIVRVIKETTGEDVDLEAATAFIEAHDIDKDRRLEFDEFVQMVLSDPTVSKPKKDKS